MKLNYLFLAGVAALFGTSAMAWEKPVPASQPLATDGTTEQYLYNVGAEGFLLGANEYLARATVFTTEGYKWQISVSDAANSYYDFKDWVSKTKYNTYNDWRYMFVGDDGVFIDNDGKKNNSHNWTITKGEGDYFRIGNGGVTGFFGTLKNLAENNRCYFYENPGADVSVDWYSVSPEAYDAYWTDLATYEAAVRLGKAIDEAKEKYSGIDLSKQENVYGNESSTAAQLDAATVEISAEINKFIVASATVDSPADMTNVIQNPSFESGAITPWKYIPSSGGDCGVKDNGDSRYTISNADGTRVVNLWSNDVSNGFKVYQSLSNLPEGVYALTALYASDAPNSADLYAGDVKTTIKAHTSGKGTGVEGTVVFVTSGGDVEIGMNSKNWIKADNFRLASYGAKAEALTKFVKSNAPDYSTAIVSKSVLATYNDLVTEKSNPTTVADAIAALETINEGAALVEANVVAWNDYKAAIEEAKGVLSNEGIDQTASDVKALATYINTTSVNIIAALELSTEEIRLETTKLEGLKAKALQCLSDGSDFTSYLKNPDMSTNTGWEGAPSYNTNAKCAEKYNCGAFDVYQEVAGAPVGLYEISMQGFYRMGSNDVAFNSFKAGSYEPMSFVYMNDSKTAMNCVFDFAVPTAESATYYGGGTVEKEGNVYPNNMTSAGKAFANGEYKVSAFGLVAKEGDKMKIGVKGNLNIGASWAIFTNFKLTYRAKNETIISQLLTEIEPSLTSKIIGSEVKAEVDALINTAKNAATGEEKFNALAQCYAMTNKVEESATIFVNLSKAVAELNAAVKTSRASAVTISDAETLAKNAGEGATGKFTNDEATNAIAEINKMIELLAIVDPANVTDANPYDYTSAIKDAGFTNLVVSGSTFGAWSFIKENVQNGPAYGKTAVEFWNGNAAEIKYFSIYQTISGLPAGTYEVKADAGNSYNGQAALGNDGRAYLYAQVSGKQVIPSTAVVPSTAKATETTNYSVIFTIAEGESVIVGFQTHGTMDARWFYCDNFTLTYYGQASTKTVTQDNMNTTTLKVSDAGYATYFGTSPFAIPEGLEVYTAVLNADKTYLTLTEITENVPAKTPVVVKGEAGDYTLVPAEAEAITADNDLKGTATEIARNDAKTTYILAEGANGICFYPYTGEKISANKAYLELDAAAASAPVIRINATVTGISNIAADAKNHAIFNLNGQRVDEMTQPGLYIVNGKKVLVK